MKRQLPIWSIPFLLALAGIAALIGNLGAVVSVVIGTETVLFCTYLVLLARREPSGPQPTANVLSLFPGHLLVLIMIALLDKPDLLAWCWTLVPVATLAYDFVGRSGGGTPRIRLSISVFLYGILWADLFFLVERAIVLHRQLSGMSEIMIAVAFGLVGALFLSLGVYRHRIAAKE
jgi:hypothetical protein